MDGFCVVFLTPRHLKISGAVPKLSMPNQHSQSSLRYGHSIRDLAGASYSAGKVSRQHSQADELASKPPQHLVRETAED